MEQLLKSEDPVVQRRLKLVLTSKDPEFKKRLLNALLKGTEAPVKGEITIVHDYGPIARMTLDDEWIDRGEWPRAQDKFHGGNRYRWLSYRLVGEGGALRINALPSPNSDKRAQLYKQFTKRSGRVNESDYDKFRYLFGTSGNPRFVTIESIEVVELGGKKVVAMTETNKESGSRAKTIYVSPPGDWREAYEISFGVGADKDFEKALEKFDKALSTIVWRQK